METRVRLPLATKALGAAAVSTAAVLLGVELARVWRLGSLAEQDTGVAPPSLAQRLRRVIRVAREGYAVSRTRGNAVFNMLVAFTVTLGGVRSITVLIRRRGGLGPIRNVQLGRRHIHHFIPGALLCLASGGTGLAVGGDTARRWLALPFGGGVALVLDETALLLELEDVYWSEEGLLSLRVAFAAMAMLAATAYGIQFLRAGNARLLEADWNAAARAWGDISRLSDLD